MKKLLLIILAICLLVGCSPKPASQPANEAATNPGLLAAPTVAETIPQATAKAPEITPAATTPLVVETAPPTTPAPTMPEATTPAPTTPAPTTPAPTTPAHHHSYTATQTAPTCAAKGYTKYTCSCGEAYKADYVDALGHSYTSKIVEPTTSSQGYTEHSCGVCAHSYKDAYTEKLPIEPCKVHDFRHKDIYKNCQQDGCREHTCIVCGYTYRDEYDYHTPDDHRYNIDRPIEVREATYDAPGYKKYKCGFCDHVETVILPQLEVIDTAALESYGRSYASSTYGYEGNSSIGASGSGYLPGVLVRIDNMQDGKNHVRGCIDSQYRNHIAAGYQIWGEKENGEIWRIELNVYVQQTNDPHVFRIWVYFR